MPWKFLNGHLKYVVRKFLSIFRLKKMNTIANLLPFHVKWCPGGQAPSAMDSESIEPLSVLRSKLKFEW